MARITVQENSIPNISNNDIHKIIDDAMEKRDRTVHILIHSVGISINVSPSNENDGMKWRQIEGGGYVCTDCGGVSLHGTMYCPNCGAQRTGYIDLEDEEK